MATTGDFKNGVCIEYNHDVYTVVEFQHVKPGKGPAFVRTKLKSLKTGKVIDNTWSAGHKIDIVRIERRPHQFLYRDDMGFYFMDINTFEQIIVDEKLVDGPDLLKEGQEVEIVYHADKEYVLGCDLPQFVTLKVTYTEPGIRGDTQTSAFKPATMETGAIIQVPLFITQDEVIKVDTRTRSYYERVKN